MNVISLIVRFAATCLVLTLAACGGGGGDGGGGGGGGGGGTPPAGTVIGAAGGTVIGPNGAKVVIPPGALATNTSIAIEQTSAGSPALPGNVVVFGPMFAVTPHGTTFALPVTVTLPFDPASVPAGRAPGLLKTNAQNEWEPVAGATFGTATVTAQVTSFSSWQLHGLQIYDPERTWEFGLFPGNSLAETQLDGATLKSGLLEEYAAFGPAAIDAPIAKSTETLPSDGVANGAVFSTANGVTFSVLAEAPYARRGTPAPIGSVSRLKQTQNFIKLTDNATFKFTLTSVIIEVGDFNPPSVDPSALIKGEVLLSVAAFKDATPGKHFFQVAGKASVWGERGAFLPNAYDESFATTHLWEVADFDFVRDDAFTIGPTTSCIGQKATMVLKKSRTFVVDLSSVGVGERFTIRIDTHAEAKNRKGGGSVDDCQASFASAYLRDPSEIGGGMAVEISGLAPTNELVVEPPFVPPLLAPASCVPGPGPVAAAGVLQFDAPSYRIDEFGGAVSTITVTRTGGSTGAVTATFSTSDGSATGGVDYTALATTVFFADGDAAPRIVTVPIIDDTLDEIDKTVNLTLSQPGGCAALGARTTAVLTIRDDDAPAVQPSGLDPTFGIGGKADSTERNNDPATAIGGDRSAMALQADGKIVMVGGTFTDFVMARFNADGSPDQDFGSGGGKVRTDMGSGLRSEEALGVAIQADGKIIVVGYTSIPNVPPAPQLPDTFALARYNPNGSLDTSFGTGGRVSGNVNGRANAVLIQADGKIVVAGEVSFPSTSGLDFSEFVVARFKTNGSLDTGFGDGVTGQIVTDFGNATNSARNIVLQPNGAIVVSGKPIGSQASLNHTDIARYDSNGRLDASFGSGGKLTLSGVDVGQGLVRQADGKFVLVGGVTEPTVPATARFVLKRLLANGSPDTSFGNAGTVDTAFTQSALASGIALQGDGKIVAVGTRALSPNSNFIVARYNPDGSVDRGFGSDGNLSIDFFGFTDIGENVLVQPDGKIVVSGQARHNVDGYGLARINP